MAGARQLRLLLWKDYLIRKRKPITLAGIAWATLVMLTLYVVRINIDNKDYPTCQFAARALPSAGMLTFLQSFVCNVNNECSLMDEFEEIPAYEKSRFTQLQRQLSPLLSNASVVSAASAAPHALRLLATLADVADHPTFARITKNGLRVSDIFRNPKRVKRLLAKELGISQEVSNSILSAEVGFEGIMQGNFDKCSVESLKKTIKVENVEHLTIFVNKLCKLENNNVQNLVKDLFLQIDLGSYVTMAGEMYSKLSGDVRITKIGNMLEAALKMMSLESFLPPELAALARGRRPEFSYVNLTMITKVMDLLQPTFGETDSYKSLREIVDTVVMGLPYLNKIIPKETDDSEEETTDVAVTNGSLETNTVVRKVSQLFSNIGDVVSELGTGDAFGDVFNILSRITNFIFKWLPNEYKNDVLFYSTLLGKLIQSADSVVNINMHLEQLAYNVSLRNPKGVKVLLSLKPHVIEQGLQALTDAERTQILTSKLGAPDEMFCDANRLKNFFLVSREEAIDLKASMCTDAWKNYINDLISSFGIYDVKNNINSMASLFILSTLGKDISDQLYSIDKDFQILKNFTKNVKMMELEEKPVIDWSPMFNTIEYNKLLELFRKKSYLGKHILITVHGSLAKEVVSQNPLLEYKISPTLKNILTMIIAMDEQLDVAPKHLQKKAKQLYPSIVLTILDTAMDEEKSYKALSTPCQDLFCHGVENASIYLNIPEIDDQDNFIATLCNITVAIDEGLKKDSIVGKAIRKIKNTVHTPVEEMDWTKLITYLNTLYEKLNEDYTYLFEYKTFGMDKQMQNKVALMMKEAKEFWLSAKNLNRIMHICVKLGLRFLDLLDRGMFDITGDEWLKLKHALLVATGPMHVADDVIQLIVGLARNDTGATDVPFKTAQAIHDILPNVPRLVVEIVDVIEKDSTDVNPIISLLNAEKPWPCAAGLADLLPLSAAAHTALSSLETLLCFDADMRGEWTKYLEERNASIFKTQTWNTTVYPENVFLKFSAAFDSSIKDFDAIKDILEIAFDEDNEGSFIFSIKHIVNVFNGTNGDIVLRNFFSKVDTVLNSINTTGLDSVPLHHLWKEYLNCTNECQIIGRVTWKYTLEYFSAFGGNVTGDLLIYFQERNEKNATFLQLLGFTRNTGLFMLYDKFPDFIAVLINSYTDLGFLNQLRRASYTYFWDCDEVVMALKPAPDSPIDAAAIQHVQPFVCPSLLHWISMPRGDNSLIDVFTKPQYLFFTLNVANLSSTYVNTYTNIKELVTLLNDVSNKNNTESSQGLDLDTMKAKLENSIDTLISFKIKDTDKSYQLFNKETRNHFTATIYLTRVVTIISKLVTELDTLKIYDTGDEVTKNLEEELSTIRKTFKRRPSEAIAFHFDLITDVLATNNKEHKMVDALKDVCERSKNKDNSKDILSEMDRVKIQICAKQYEILYSSVQHVLDEDFDSASNSLKNLVQTLESENERDSDVFMFFKKRQNMVDSLKTSLKYSYDLGIPIYVKYLQNNLKHYDIILSFLTGGDWWGQLRQLYSGPKATNFFDTIEKSFDIAEDVFTHLDRIHLVRLLRDINMNNTEDLCRPNITLSDYVPDSSGELSALHRQICDIDHTELFKEIPPLMFASQGYNNDLKMSRDIDYEVLYGDIAHTESALDLIREGPHSPTRPSWVTEEKVQMFRNVVLQLLSKESLIKISFGVVSNFVDAGTLLINNSDCTLCSQLTSWFKQLHLQLFKKQEYDALLCSLDEHSASSVHNALTNDFHWDMAVSEIISTRNYTKYELNKSLNELLEQIKLHLLEDVSAPSTKLFDCLAANVSGNAFGHASLFAKVAARTTRLLRIQLPYLQEVPGITNLPYLKQLQANIAHTLNARDNLSTYLVNSEEMIQDLVKIVNDKDLVNKIEGAMINLYLIKDLQSINDCISVQDHSWDEICKDHNCEDIMRIMSKHINMTLVGVNLPKVQTKEFWQFNFVSTILKHVEAIVEHIARLLGVLSRVDARGVRGARLAALLDTGLQLMMDDVLDSVLYSVLGLLEELKPIVRGTALEFDVTAVTDGLQIIRQFKNCLIDEDFKLNVSQIFSNPNRLEASLSSLGVNNTNFWSIAAPRIHAGYIAIKPLFTQKQGIYHISDFVCQTDNMSKVIIPGGGAAGVTVDDVYGAVMEQFCGITDEQAKAVVLILLENVDFDFVIEKLKSLLLTKLFVASNLTQSEGDTVLSEFNNMAAILPELQGSLSNVSESLSKEPLLLRLKKSTSFGDMLASSDFLKEAGTMLCGKPFYSDVGRFYTAIARTKDFSTEPDRKQLDALPTEFCRSLYKDIIAMDGGKVLWSFIKPLLLGKILYTPVNPIVQKIIEQANSTFTPTVKVVNLVHSFAESFSSVDKLTEHKSGLDALMNIMTSPQYAEIRKSLIGDVQAPNIDVDEVVAGLGDTQSLGALVRRASRLLRCVSLDRFRPARDERALALGAARLAAVNEFSAGLVFLNMSENESEIPLNMEYKIRMDINSVPTTKRLKTYLWTPGPESSFLENMRYFRGFVQIQDMINKAIIQLSPDTSRNIQKREASVTDDDWAVYTQQVPYPCYRKDLFQTSLYESQSLIVAFFFSLLFTVSSAVRFIVEDKESGNTMLMSVMGVRLRYHTLAWAAWTLLELGVTAGAVVGVLSAGGVLPRSDPSLLYVLLLIFSFSVIAFCYMMSTLCSSASSGAVASGIAYLITFMPIVLILSLETALNSPLKIFICLSMSSSLCYAFLFVTRLEAMGVGAGWAQLWDSPGGDGDMSIATAAAMMLVDACIYIAIGCVINYFYGIKSESNITVCPASGEKAGVSVVGVTKIYDEGSRTAKLALDNVSMELHKGQITTLLGHNGAGKTTLIKILTGMLKPTKGHVVVRTEDSEGEGGGARLGVCPQRDVLFEYMSAHEHIALYAQLKSGKSLAEVQDEVDSISRALGLGALGARAVARLSGGTRRRLCVALAFVARPALVSLDEPTAGVDPAARRDIWSLIMKLRENRTILMTTHLLDEAELLSDQIIIMHKGQIHTTGSPIEIKRSLGTGYKLTVMYPDKKLNHLEAADDEEVSIEEKTKNLLAVTRSVVKNANVMDVNDSEVEINLPFYDADGVSNNFLELTLALEQHRDALAYRSLSLDCSSLEQVFHAICQQQENGDSPEVSSIPESTSKSASTSSLPADVAPLVERDGPLKGSLRQQFAALMYARYLHYIRNKWLLFLVLALPSLFLVAAMGFSTIRPPADNEVPLLLHAGLYENSTQFIVSHPSTYADDVDSSFAQQILDDLRYNTQSRNLSSEDSVTCQCVESIQHCDIDEARAPRRPPLMVAPDVRALNRWLVDSEQFYREKRYIGYSAVARAPGARLVAWYNNKGHHALPAALGALHAAALRARRPAAALAVYSHPLKISKEDLNKDTVYQHIADAGISGMVLVAYALAGAGGALYAVAARRGARVRLALLAGAPPAALCAAALLWDLMIIFINMVITAIVLEVFHFPVFVARNNLPAICILIMLYGYACANLVHVAEKAFREASLASMLLFCGNAFAGLAGIAALIVLDVISDSDATDHARWVLHKILLLSPQFALGDGLLEIAKNTIQAEVLSQFAMDTYRDPLSENVVGYHYAALVLVGTLLLALNLAIEYDCFEFILSRCRRGPPEEAEGAEEEAPDVRAEERRVRATLRPLRPLRPLRLHTIGNINAGFVDTEDMMKKGSLSLSRAEKERERERERELEGAGADACAALRLRRAYGPHVALHALTLGVPPGQCTALLGENGAGKSTTFALLTGQLRPSAGHVLLRGRRAAPRDLCQGHISYCPQTDAVDPMMTVEETLIYFCMLRGIDNREETVRRTLQALGLRHFARVRCAALSGGNRRKLCAAAALMSRAPLVLLDEPTR
ncbi:unnamed protein product, partial [Brenthis ino]